MNVRRILLACTAVVLAAHAAPALAAGPVKVEAFAAWWHNDLRFDTLSVSSSDSAGAASLRASVYVADLGVRAARYRSRVDAGNDAVYTSADFVWRPIALTSNNFLALGAGYERFEIDHAGANSTAAGPRLVAEGRVGVAGIFYAYGEAAWSPRLGSFDLDAAGTRMTGVSSREYEAGVGISPFPFLRVRLGYRDARVSGTVDAGGTRGSANLGSKGPILSVGVNF